MQLLQLSVSALLHQLQSADELGDCAAQASKQLRQVALLLFLWLNLDCAHILFRSDGCDAGEGAHLAEQSFTLWLESVWRDWRESKT